MNITLRQNDHVINLKVHSDDIGKLMEAIFPMFNKNQNVTVDINQEPAYQGTVNPAPASIKMEAVYAGKQYCVQPKSAEAIKYLLQIVPGMKLDKALSFVQSCEGQHVGDFNEQEANVIVETLRFFGLNAWTDDV